MEQGNKVPFSQVAASQASSHLQKLDYLKVKIIFHQPDKSTRTIMYCFIHLATNAAQEKVFYALLLPSKYSVRSDNMNPCFFTTTKSSSIKVKLTSSRKNHLLASDSPARIDPYVRCSHHRHILIVITPNCNNLKNNSKFYMEQLGNLKFERTIGSGTFGKVRRAIHLPTGKPVAVKVLNKHRIANKKDALRIHR
jgi:hypothetical protein